MEIKRPVIEKIKDLGARYFPTQATLEVTHRCNASCEYCYLENRPSNEPSTEQIKSIIDKINDAGILTMNMTGGEPFIREDIIEILEHIISKNFFSTTILSNGSIIDEHHVKFLISVHEYLGYIRFSVFSHDHTIHDKYVGVPGALQNILTQGHALMSHGIQVHCMLNLLDINVNEIQQSIQFFESEGFVTQLSFTKLLTSPHLSSILQSEISRKFFDNFINNLPIELQNGYREAFCKYVSGEKKRGMCDKLKNAISVDCYGNIRPCTSFRNLIIGNVLTDSRPIHTILENSSIYKSIRAISKNDIPKCRNCKYKTYCLVCLGEMHTERGDFAIPPAQTCHYALALDNEVLA